MGTNIGKAIDVNGNIIYVKSRKQQRIERRLGKIKKAAERRREVHELIKLHGSDILESDKFKMTKEHVQHGSMSVNEHCKNVTIASLMINSKLRLNANKREMIRGALLHDYFLYDWHDKELLKGQKLHGYAHPETALRNADEDYELTEKQRDIIGNHMWPLTLLHIPRCREAWIVTAADKYCSLMETIGIHKGVKERVRVRKEDDFM